MSFEGKVAIITGGRRGIGRAIAETFARGCAQVVIADRDLAEAQCTADEIVAATGCKALAVAVDVAESHSVSLMVEGCQARFGRVDILVNNAGVTRDTLIIRMDESDWDTVLDVNRRAPELLRAVVRPMIKQRYGRIVNLVRLRLAGAKGEAGLIRPKPWRGSNLAASINAVAPGL
jgi:3-oxoacyl-[acyl-carrier protein] reductase